MREGSESKIEKTGEIRRGMPTKKQVGTPRAADNWTKNRMRPLKQERGRGNEREREKLVCP